MAPAGSLSRLGALPGRARKASSVRANAVQKEDPFLAGDFKRMVDSERQLKRFGPTFGGVFRVLDEAPRVRVRHTKERPQDQLVDLAVLNAKLTGADPVIARNKLERIKKRRETWEEVYRRLLEKDAQATIEEIEALALAVDETMSAQATERASISELNEELREMQAKLEAARQTLSLTEARIAHNVGRIAELEAEADSLQRSYAAAADDALVAAARTSPDPRAAEFRTAARAAPAAAPAPTSAGARAAGSEGASGSGRAPVPAPRRPRKGAGLPSSLELEPELKEFWFPVAFSAHLKPGTMVPFELFGQPWVMFRSDDGTVGCLYDQCAHRACPLSLGKVSGSRVACAYHGWEFNASGACERMPSTAFCKGVRVRSMPVVEEGGLVWAWPGNGTPPPHRPVADISPPEGFEVHAEICIEVPVEHGLLIENLLDLAHAPFTHVNTFAKGWPVPDIVKFQTNRLLGGDWHPYPIKMSFEPPCMTLSTIGLDAPGKPVRGSLADECDKHLHQLHVCLPSKPGHTRLLYRMSLDFLGWMRNLPFTGETPGRT